MVVDTAADDAWDDTEILQVCHFDVFCFLGNFTRLLMPQLRATAKAPVVEIMLNERGMI